MTFHLICAYAHTDTWLSTDFANRMVTNYLDYSNSLKKKYHECVEMLIYMQNVMILKNEHMARCLAAEHILDRGRYS